MSITQTTNFIALAGVIVAILAHFKITATTEDIQSLIGAIITIVGIVSNYVHRYNKGDVTLGGAKLQ